MSKKKKDEPKIYRRSAGLRLSSEGIPSTLDVENRSVEVVAATEEPTLVFNYETWRTEKEILLMSGMRKPEGGKIPLLDSHERYSTKFVIGSARELKIDGSQLLARSFFSSVDDAEEIFTKVREGHVTDVSIGYVVHTHLRVKDGETTEFAGQKFEGPVIIATDWTPRELSWCPIGADQNAKARNAPGKPEEIMPPEKLEELRKRFNMPGATEAEILKELETRALAGGESQRKAPHDGGSTPPVANPPVSHVDTPVMPPDDGRAEAAEIVAACAQHGCSERAAEWLQAGHSVDKVRQLILDEMLSRSAQQETPGQRIEGGRTDKEKFREAAQNGIMLRAGLDGDRSIAGDLGGYSLVEVARRSLDMMGLPSGGMPYEVVGRALSTSDLPTILGGVAERAILAGYEEEQNTYEIWCDTSGVLTDFRKKDLARVGEFSNLDEIPEGKEYEYGTIGEESETVCLTKFGKLFAITREAMVNDDLDVLSTTPKNMGEAAARKIADLPYAVLAANANLSDGNPLFSVESNNLVSPGTVLGTASLDLGFSTMADQKDIDGERRLNIIPQFFLAPTSIRGACEQFFKTVEIGGKVNQPKLANIYSGDVLTRVYDSRLTDISKKCWFLAGRKGRTVKMFFLNGNKKPYLEFRNGWNVDGAEFKLRVEAAARALGRKALYKNEG